MSQDEALNVKQPADVKILTVGICGGTSSGKTTLFQNIKQKMGRPNLSVLHHDNYYKDITHLSILEREQTNFDHPDSLDTALLISHIKALKQNTSIMMPTYDFSKHARTNVTERVVPTKIILVEGILIFSDKELVDLLDVKVFVDAPSDLRLMRRMSRDTTERGRTIEQVMEQYERTVRPMHEMYVEPSKHVSDMIVNDGRNTVVLDMIVAYLTNVAGVELGDTCDSS